MTHVALTCYESTHLYGQTIQVWIFKQFAWFYRSSLMGGVGHILICKSNDNIFGVLAEPRTNDLPHTIAQPEIL